MIKFIIFFLFLINMLPILAEEIPTEPPAPAPVVVPVAPSEEGPTGAAPAPPEPIAAASATPLNAGIRSAIGESELKNLNCNLISSAIAIKKIKDVCEGLKKSASMCSSVYNTSAPACFTETNPQLQSALTQAQAVMGAVQGISDSCSAFNKAMGIAKMGVAAYALGCGAAKKSCDVSCSSAVQKLNVLADLIKAPSLKADLDKCKSANSVDSEACAADLANLDTNLLPRISEELDQQGKTVVSKANKCKVDMTSLLAMAGINIGSLAQSMMAGNKCKKETQAAEATDCTQPGNKDKPECKVVSNIIDCALPLNADKPICICKANPRLAGCAGVSTTLARSSTLGSGGAPGSASGAGGAKLTESPALAENSKFPADFVSTSKNDGVGSGTGGGGPSSSGLTASSDGTSSGSELGKNSAPGNANILSYESGSGGGYRFGSGSSGSAARSAQLRGLAQANGIQGKFTGQGWTSQVTSLAGKSNFDKVKVRYNENRTSLLSK